MTVFATSYAVLYRFDFLYLYKLSRLLSPHHLSFLGSLYLQQFQEITPSYELFLLTTVALCNHVVRLSLSGLPASGCHCDMKWANHRPNTYFPQEVNRIYSFTLSVLTPLNQSTATQRC